MLSLPLLPTPDDVAHAAANTFDMLVRGGVADLRRTPARDHRRGAPGHGLPVPRRRRRARATCPCCWSRRWPRRRSASTCAAAARWPSTCSGSGTRPTWWTTGRSRSLTATSGSSTGSRTSCRGRSARSPSTPAASPCRSSAGAWAASCRCSRWPPGRDLPVNSIAAVASPFDFAQLRMFAPIRGVANITNGLFGTAVYRALGGAPAPLVKRVLPARRRSTSTSPSRSRSRTNLHDRDFLAQIEAVDHFIDNMHAYPGRTMGQLYHQFFRVNDLADGELELGDHDDRPGRRARPRPGDRGQDRHAGAARGRPPRRRAADGFARRSSSRRGRAATSGC